MFLAGFKRPRISVGACDSTECRWLTDDAERSSKSGDLLGCRNFCLFSLGLSSLEEDASQISKRKGDPSTSDLSSSFLARSQCDLIYRPCKRSRLHPRRLCFQRIPVHLLLAQSSVSPDDYRVVTPPPSRSPVDPKPLASPGDDPVPTFSMATVIS